MSIDNLERMFHPRSLAVVGAGNKTGSIGNAMMKNIIHAGYHGDLFPIHPNRDPVCDVPSFARLEDVPEVPDLVVVTTPIDQAPDIITACGNMGVGGAVIIAGGGKEIGGRGMAVETAIRTAAVKSGVRIIGPNCMGICCTADRLNASYATQAPLSGKMAFISQSCGINTAILDLSIKEHIGFSYFVSLGSMLDVNFGDMIDYLGGDPQVSSIVMYIESLTRFRGFMSAARAVSRVKPIIALKAGRTRAGAAAAISHTGAMAGEDSVYDAAFKRAGIIRVRTFEELFDCAELAAKQPRIKGPGLAILTNSGGAGVMAADTLADYGIDPVSFSEDTIEQLNRVLPVNWSHGNPVDILGNASEALFTQTVQICRQAKEVHGLMIILAPDAVNDPTAVAASLVQVLKEKPFPLFTVWLGGPSVEKGREIFNHAGIPTFDSPERAVRAYMDLYQHARNIEMLQEIPPKLPAKPQFERIEAEERIRKNLSQKRPVLTEIEAKSLLSTYGIPVNPAVNVTTAVQAALCAEKIGFPVVMKIHSGDIPHKSEAGGVRLNIANTREVHEAFDGIIADIRAHHPNADIQGVTIQKMVPPPDFELIIGAKKDQDFGPVILFGMGGIYTEILKDRAIGLPPLNRLLARRIMEETKAFQILKGFRHQAPADIIRLEEMLIRVSQLVTDFPQIEELDINPIFVRGKEIVAVDARVILKPSTRQAPFHLVISSYPVEQEQQVAIQGVGSVRIRPVKPEDAPLMASLFHSLSRQSIYNRFFTPLRQLPASMLARFTQIDYDREIALVAVLEDGPEEKMLGAARIIRENTPEASEFAVLVGDPWHGKGIGATLLKKCLILAKNLGIPRVCGLVLAGNTQMLALGRKLGFKIERQKDGGEYFLSIDLQTFSIGDLNQQ